MRSILTFLLCYLPLTTLTALVLARNTSTPRLLSDESTTSTSLNISNPPSISISSKSSNSTRDFYPFPHRFRVPGTDTVLHLGFGMRRSLDPLHVRSLIAVAEDYIDEEIENLPHIPGFEPLYPAAGGLNQLFYKTLGDGIVLMVRNNVEAGKMFTWEELRDVVVGLRLYLVDGRRFWQTRFKFYSGGYAPDVTTRNIGFGMVIPEEDESDDEMGVDVATEKRG